MPAQPHSDRQADDRKEQRRHNSTYKKLAVQWLNEALYFVSSFTHAGFIFSGIREPCGVVVAGSFVLRNRQLLKTANHRATCLGTLQT